MRCLLRFPSLLIVLLLTAAVMRAALPPLSGELTGKLNLKSLPGAPAVAWRAQLQPEENGAARLEVRLEAPGLFLLVEAWPDAGRWQVKEGRVTLAQWLGPGLAAVDAAVPGDLEVEGVAVLGGHGTFGGADFTGAVTVALTGGVARSAEQGWVADGVALEAVLQAGPAGVALETARLGVGAFTAYDLALQDFSVEAEGVPGGLIAVRRAEGHLLDGRVALTPFTFSPQHIEASALAEFTDLSLERIAHLLPEALTAATGSVSGQVGVNWSPDLGAVPSRGALIMSPATPATLRLSPSPGFLTGRVPERIALLPDWLGPLARWFSPVNPAYETLRQIEEGEMALVVEKLEVQLYPDGLEGPRSAVVRVVAHPTGEAVVERVDFTVNVSGPLDQVIRLGLDERAQLNLRLR